MPENNDRPIKHVKFSSDDKGISLVSGGGPKKSFKVVTEDFTEEIIGEIESIKDFIVSHNISTTISVVEIEKEALAKSHRPTSIFNGRTCPFIGDIGLSEENTGQFLIRISRQGLELLEEKINHIDTNESIKSELSTIKNIRFFEPKIDIENEKKILVRLVSLKDAELQQEVNSKFLSIIEEYDISHSVVLEDPYIYYIDLQGNNEQDLINSFIADLENAAILFSAQKAQSIFIKPMELEDAEPLPVNVPEPEDGIDYPVVAVVDTSVKIGCPLISPWVVGEETAIIEEDRDYSHGTFVSGLITNGSFYNSPHPGFPRTQSKVFSIGVLGRNGGSFPEIKDKMELAQRDNPEICVWNLSLGEDGPVSMYEISKFAIWLDKFQQENNCICVISAGNINNPVDHRSWPPAPTCPQDVQRISSPGDSVMGISVAAMSHVDIPGTIGMNEPACYSRSGPVANLILKPDLIHYGGTVPFGIKSIAGNDASCMLAQDRGTSFSAPLISTMTANLWKRMGEETPRYIVKGMLAHSAKLDHEIDNEHRAYYGWGKPQEPDEILYCDENEITVIFEGEIASNREVIHKLPFPIVPSMRLDNGKVRGEFFMTVSYDPPVDPDRAFEYCLVNVEAGLGEVSVDGNFKNKIPAEKSGFEYELIGGRYKWSPVKVYHKRFSQGVNVENWKLQIKMMTRDGFTPADDFKQKFAVILTIRGLDNDAQVYNEMVRLMNEYNWEVSNAVVIEPTIRV